LAFLTGWPLGARQLLRRRFAAIDHRHTAAVPYPDPLRGLCGVRL